MYLLNNWFLIIYNKKKIIWTAALFNLVYIFNVHNIQTQYLEGPHMHWVIFYFFFFQTILINRNWEFWRIKLNHDLFCDSRNFNKKGFLIFIYFAEPTTWVWNTALNDSLYSIRLEYTTQLLKSEQIFKTLGIIHLPTL